jgi:low affinity Fe/Cu permease
MGQERGNWALRTVSSTTSALGSLPAILVAISVILVWGVSGPLFGFSDTWQLIINTFTTLVTFVMVFVIQSSQNRDGRAIQVKLDEILLVISAADDGLIGIEDLPEKKIRDLQARVREIAEEAGRSTS